MLELFAVCKAKLCDLHLQVFSEAERDRVETTHLKRWHPEHAVDQLELLGDRDVTPEYAIWETVALDAVATLARTGTEFVIYDVHQYGVGEPPDPAHDWGRLTVKAKQQGLIEKVLTADGTPKAIESKRRETRGSLVKVWRGTARMRVHTQGELTG